ncbi:putative oxidoreductase C1F5.03c [Mercurialis annua]|uniref:putative oxidoreductase C1F5.03c n=1 Tax=Mercurialis annua TaxID=3986 RepID=UPI00215E9142|nr:putative oxidoreductase C1F5.03c [Mercurialis annua]
MVLTLAASPSPFSTISPYLRRNRIYGRKISPFQCLSSTSMDNHKQKHIVVCGGGIIGVCTAYFLSKRGVSVTLIEKSSIACGASGKSGGFLALDWCDGGPLSSLARASFNLHRSLAQELNGAELYGYRPLTTLSLTVTESNNQNQNQSSKSDKNIPSWIDGHARSPRTIGTSETTAQVHPKLFTEAILSKAVKDHGVEVVIGKVERVEVAVVEDVGRVEAVVLEGGRVIKCDDVVLALGPWSGKFETLRDLFRVYGLKAHSVVIEPKERDVITAHALFLSYYGSQGGKPMDPEVYPRPSGEVYVCGMSSDVEVLENPEEIVGDPESIRVLKRVAESVSSHLAEGQAQIKAEQACFLPCTDDGIPVIGEIPGVKGCYVATGHNCWGILNGPATGAAMAELVLDGKSTIVDLSKFSPVRFLGRRNC